MHIESDSHCLLFDVTKFFQSFPNRKEWLQQKSASHPCPVQRIQRAYSDHTLTEEREIEPMLKDDKAFATYALSLIAAVVCLLSAVVYSQLGTPPTAAQFIEHLAIGLLFRGAYKSLDGSNFIRDTLEFTGMMGGAQEAPDMAETIPA